MKAIDMKVLIISNMYPDDKNPSYGVFVEKFCNQLEKIGLSYNLSVMYKANSRISKIKNYIFFYFDALIRILFSKYDLIYVHYASHSSIPVLIAKPFIRSKVYVNVHGSDIFPENKKQLMMQNITKCILLKSDKIIVPSEYFFKYIVKEFSIEEKKIEIYPSAGIDTNIFKMNVEVKTPQFLQILENKGNKKVFGFCGRISEGKGWDTFIQAIDNLKNSKRLNGIYILVGDGPQSDELERLIEEKKLGDIVIYFKQLLPQIELASFFSTIDYLVFPTRRNGESLGLVALESMACGTPVICSNFAAPKYYIDDGGNGIKFEVNSPSSLAEAILRAENQSLIEYSQMSNSARETASEYFEDNILPKLEKIIKQ
ncbi:TPA: glycosyltransferase family 4 protein [Streptococcus suis]